MFIPGCDAARWREIDCVVVWRLDRWRRWLVDLVSTLQEFTARSRLVSLSEALDLITPSGRALARKQLGVSRTSVSRLLRSLKGS